MKNQSKLLCVFCICLLNLCLLDGFSQKKKTIIAEEISSSLAYTMQNPIHSWTGTSNAFSAKIVYDFDSQKIESANVEATILSFDSNIGRRDATSFKILEEKIFPKVSFFSEEIIENNNEILLKGILNFHGINKRISVKAQKNLNKNQLCVKGAFSIKLTDFNLKPPSLIGLKAEDNIDIRFLMNFIINKQQ